MNQSPDTAQSLPEGTPEALLAAARKLFPRKGFDGTSVREITTEAGANLGAITYHFGSKRALYDQVLESFVQPLASRVTAAVSGPGDVFERVNAVIRAYFDYLAEEPDAPNMIMQDVVLGEISELALNRLRPVQQAISGLVREGQQEGVMRPGNPAVMAMSIISQPVHLMLMRKAFRVLTGMDLGDPVVREQFVANAMAFARGGLALSSKEGTP